MMLEFKNPIHVVVKDTNEDGYAIYVTNAGTYENDVWCVVLKSGGTIRHYLTNQLVVHQNLTFGIKKQ